MVSQEISLLVLLRFTLHPVRPFAFLIDDLHLSLTLHIPHSLP